MLLAATDMFLLIPGESNQRILHPGKVLESSSENFVVQFEQAILPEVGSDVVAYGEVNRKFFQQGAKTLEVRLPGPTPVLAFARCGEPVSAENRQTFRVSTVTCGITAFVGKERNCPVVDVSPEGFGAVVKGDLMVGSLVPIEFQYEGHTIKTPARVQTIKVRPDGQIRYGFLAPEKLGTTRRSLQQMTSALQRAQLRRLAGAA
jgi:hypothetical protein